METMRTEFLNANRQYWSQRWENVSDSLSGHILVDACGHTVKGNIHMLTVSNHIAQQSGLEPVFLIRGNHKERIEVCKSFYPGEVHPIGANMPYNELDQLFSTSPIDTVFSLKSIAGNLFSFGHSVLPDLTEIPNGVRLFFDVRREVDTVDELIELTVDGIPLGVLVYNQASRVSGRGTLKLTDRALQLYLLIGCLMFKQWEQIFDNYNVQAVTVGHFFYLWRGLIGRFGLREGADVFNVKGRGEVRKYRHLKETDSRPKRPTEDLFNCILNKHREKATNNANKLLRERIGIDPNEVSIGTEVHVLGTEDSLLEEVGLDPDNPTLLLMHQNFIENISDGLLFRDHQTWFVRVCQYAAKQENMNLLVKPHPNREFYLEQGQRSIETVLAETGIDAGNIVILSENTPIAPIIDATDVLTTINGTPGLEYASYGLPVLIGGKNRYSGFGFTLCPDSVSEYFSLLDDIEDITPLDESQRIRAKVMCYLQLNLFTGNFPTINSQDGSEWSGALRIAEQHDKSSLAESVQNFLKNDHNNLFPVTEIDC